MNEFTVLGDVVFNSPHYVLPLHIVSTKHLCVKLSWHRFRDIWFVYFSIEIMFFSHLLALIINNTLMLDRN